MRFELCIILSHFPHLCLFGFKVAEAEPCHKPERGGGVTLALNEAQCFQARKDRIQDGVVYCAGSAGRGREQLLEDVSAYILLLQAYLRVRALTKEADNGLPDREQGQTLLVLLHVFDLLLLK